MRKVVLNIAVSLDGFIADRFGGIQWLSGCGAAPQLQTSYQEFISSVDTIVMGRITYEHIVTELSPHCWPYDDYKSYVLTSKTGRKKSYAKFLTVDPCEFIKELRVQDGGKDIWIIGGAKFSNPLIRANLIDRYYIAVIPIIMGDGVKLFGDSNPKIDLSLERCNVIDGIVSAVYSKK